MGPGLCQGDPKLKPSIKTQYWRLSSDNYPTSSPGGYSAHSDWWYGWDSSIVNRFVNNCLRSGLDCPIGNLNDGWALN